MIDYIPQYIMDEKFFIMHDIYKNTISNFFIHSAKNNFLIKSQRIFLEEYWKNEDFAIDYFFFHAFFSIMIKENPTAKEIWNDVPIGLNHNTWLINRIFDKDYSEKLWKYLLKTSFMYKLTYKNKNAEKNPNSWYRFIVNQNREKQER